MYITRGFITCILWGTTILDNPWYLLPLLGSTELLGCHTLVASSKSKTWGCPGLFSKSFQSNGILDTFTGCHPPLFTNCQGKLLEFQNLNQGGFWGNSIWGDSIICPWLLRENGIKGPDLNASQKTIRKTRPFEKRRLRTTMIQGGGCWWRGVSPIPNEQRETEPWRATFHYTDWFIGILFHQVCHYHLKQP